jgi:hypothetical protein
MKSHYCYTSLLRKHFRLYLYYLSAQQQHPPIGGQATHANAKTKAYPKSVAAFSQ